MASKINNFNRFLFENKKWTNDEILNKFFDELSDGNKLQVNPFRPRELFLNDECMLEINRFDMKDKKEIVLQDISVIAKGKGIGKKSLKIITDAADKLGYAITLYAKPFGTGGLNKKDLIDFYKRNGFETVKGQYGIRSTKEIEEYVLSEDSEDLKMMRKPKQ